MLEINAWLEMQEQVVKFCARRGVTTVVLVVQQKHEVRKSAELLL